jgi:hypothetical protein
MADLRPHLLALLITTILPGLATERFGKSIA